MKRLFMLLVIMMPLVSFSQTNDTIAATTNNLRFITIEENSKRIRTAVYEGKEYVVQGSISNYKRQVKYYGDCRILIVNDKIIIL